MNNVILFGLFLNICEKYLIIFGGFTKYIFWLFTVPNIQFNSRRSRQTRRMPRPHWFLLMPSVACDVSF